MLLKHCEIVRHKDGVVIDSHIKWWLVKVVTRERIKCYDMVRF